MKSIRLSYWAVTILVVIYTPLQATQDNMTQTWNPVSTTWRDQVMTGLLDHEQANTPFSFLYDGRHFRDSLQDWKTIRNPVRLEDAKQEQISTYTDPKTGLQVTCTVIHYKDSPACEWVLHFENTGSLDTPIIEDVLAMDLVLDDPKYKSPAFVLHRTYGCQSGGSRGPQVDFDITKIPFQGDEDITMKPKGGRSSDQYFPFFRIDSAKGSAVIAIGWSGQWQADFRCHQGKELHVTAGLERTHFKLHPGERVRSPRILTFFWEGDPVECYSQFRRLIYNHYVPDYQGKKPLPFLYANTCFLNYWPSILERIQAEYPKRGGTPRHEWMSDLNEDSEISIIRALAPLGAEAVVTDAGWFKDGWPAGSGVDWEPEPRTFPQGMAPVAQAAHENDMAYGLWFEPEKVSARARIAKERPELVLWVKQQRNRGLLNFGLPAARAYFLGILERYLSLPGFRLYRQDFNMSPLAFWRQNDAPDRQGITEMKYIEGLYTFWEEIRMCYPDTFMIECAAGGKRFDLETVKNFHTHQKSDIWLSKSFNVAANYSLSRFLPNVCFNTPTKDLDDYAFHLSLPSSMCIGGWGADQPDFPTDRARTLTSRYLAVRECLVGDWYPLTDYGKKGWNQDSNWLASQYHRPDLGKGLVLAFRRGPDTPSTRTVSLQGLDPKSSYQLTFETTGRQRQLTGAALHQGLDVTLPTTPASEMIIYQKTPAPTKR